MKIVAVADTHLHEIDLPEGDLLLHAGDLTNYGTMAELDKAASWLQDQKVKKGFKTAVVIAGNHDWSFQREPEMARALMKEKGLHYLEDSGIIIDESGALAQKFTLGLSLITIHGSPWIPDSPEWAFSLIRGPQIREKRDLIPIGTDILVTHSPPYGILDEAPASAPSPAAGARPVRHAGCEELLKALGRVKPKVHIFGHVHASRGKIDRNDTLFVNACILDSEDIPRKEAIAFDYPV